MPVKQLHWLDGKLDLFNQKYVLWKGLEFFRLPKSVLLGIGKIVNEFEVVHTSENSNFFSLQAALWARLKGKKFVFSAGQNIPYPLKQRNFFTWHAKKFVNDTACAITTTTTLGKRALIHEGVNPDKITVIPNALDFKYFDKGPKNSANVGLPKELNSTFNILFVHRLKEPKGVLYLVAAFEDLEKKYGDMRLIVVGDNHLDEAYYRKHIKANQKIYHVESVPNTQIQYLYNLSDVVVLPSLAIANNEEQFGMTLLEAIACGVPTIVTNVGGLPYVAEKNLTSLVINDRSEKEIKEAIEQLYENKALRQRLGKYSYKYVRENFSKEAIGKRLYRFYKNI